MILLNDFVHIYILKNKATTNIKIYKVLKNIGLDSKVRIYLRDGDFSTIYGIFNLHPSRGNHWFCYIKDCYFDSYRCSQPKKLPKYINNRHRKCIYSENQILKNDSFYASF